MQDIIRPKRSLREVLPKKESRPREKLLEQSTAYEYEPPVAPPKSRATGRGRFWGWSLGLIALLAIIFVVSQAFAQATIKVEPRQGKLLLNGTYQASREGADGGLAFKVMRLEDVASKEVPASGIQKIETRASGRITIYNAFSTDSQRLVANTRFETPEGKIYRINEPITVPGGTSKGTELVPGTIEATVYADAPGVEYNTDKSDFTIPGFKGSPRYEKFYAKTTTAISGGLVGEGKAVSTEDKSKARAELQNILRERLVKDARNQIPPDFVLYDDAIFFSFEEDITATTSSADKAQVREKGVLTGLLFNLEDLAGYLAADNIPDYNKERLTLDNPGNTNFTIKDKDVVNPQTAEEIIFKLEGNAHIIWVYDQDELRTQLRNNRNKNYQAVFAKFPAISKAEVIFRPPWIRSLPDKPEKIKIVNVIDK